MYKIIIKQKNINRRSSEKKLISTFSSKVVKITYTSIMLLIDTIIILTVVLINMQICLKQSKENRYLQKKVFFFFADINKFFVYFLKLFIMYGSKKIKLKSSYTFDV